MNHPSYRNLQQFKNSVGLKFQLYNSLFTSLPFHRIEKTGVMLSLLLSHCEEGYKKKGSPAQIISDFFSRYTSISEDRDKVDMLFRFVQYVERQVVLFDALEDASFKEVTDVYGAGSLKHLQSEVLRNDATEELQKKLNDFSIRLVLTAHPTQFYPGAVLGIINDLSRAVIDNNAEKINSYLQQLGKTPFLKKTAPTPYDEAISLIWYLENIFYYAAGRILSLLKTEFPGAITENNPVVTMGFWPGGDRDGNPNVTNEITRKVADSLRSSIIRCYYLDIRKLKRRLTFKGIDTVLAELEGRLYNQLFSSAVEPLSAAGLLQQLNEIRQTLIYQHNSLFLPLLDSLINKIHVFGLHFASLDIRQESSVHNTIFEAIAQKENILPANYSELPEADKIGLLMAISAIANAALYEDELIRDTLQIPEAVRQIQQRNGERGCSRYIISQTNSALNVIEVYGLFLLNGWKKEELTVDIVPLFETIDDLRRAAGIMRSLYEQPGYRQHLKRRGDTQTIMVGFSDGTKDGGYLMANWRIYKAKEELTAISKQYNIDVVFFDGRGGPPARGGGKTHQFYASMGKNIANKEIQLTIQGQTVSSNFGNIDSAQYNIEQLLHAGISNDLFSKKNSYLTEDQEALIEALAEEGLQSYLGLKNHPYFLDYLSHVSPLKFYAQTNIGSRPAKRGGSSRLQLKDLRAIPFVGAWSQLKQNVPGFYGVGTALQAMDKKGRLGEVKTLYEQSLYFRTLIDNCEMAMKKSFFPLTAFLADHPQYGEIWNMVCSEYELTIRYVLIISSKTELMADYPVDQLSIQMRERIVLPLLTIQQYAMARIREIDAAGGGHATLRESLERLVVRCSFGIINAGRNSV